MATDIGKNEIFVHNQMLEAFENIEEEEVLLIREYAWQALIHYVLPV